jgi:hypothetical protein
LLVVVMITDKVDFTADGQILTFAGDSTLTGGSDFAGNAATLIIDSTANAASLSGGKITDSSGNGKGTVSIIGIYILKTLLRLVLAVVRSMVKYIFQVILLLILVR